jgi:hypothetical protein
VCIYNPAVISLLETVLAFLATHLEDRGLADPSSAKDDQLDEVNAGRLLVVAARGALRPILSAFID